MITIYNIASQLRNGLWPEILVLKNEFSRFDIGGTGSIEIWDKTPIPLSSNAAVFTTSPEDPDGWRLYTMTIDGTWLMFILAESPSRSCVFDVVARYVMQEPVGFSLGKLVEFLHDCEQNQG